MWLLELVLELLLAIGLKQLLNLSDRLLLFEAYEEMGLNYIAGSCFGASFLNQSGLKDSGSFLAAGMKLSFD